MQAWWFTRPQCRDAGVFDVALRYGYRIDWSAGISIRYYCGISEHWIALLSFEANIGAVL